jgi:hypothetical protein
VNAPVLNDNAIEDFLGPEICNTSVVLNSKLTENEKMLINNPFSIGELDSAVKAAKSATAGGPDGIGNACIKKFGHTLGCRLQIMQIIALSPEI